MGTCEVLAAIPYDAVDAAEAHLVEHADPAWGIRQEALRRRAWIVGFFSNESEARRHWRGLQPLPVPAGRPQFARVEETDWRESYKAHFHAWRFGPLHWIPEWERGRRRIPEGEVAVYLDPGLAFGTGNHETTRLCVEQMVAFAARLRSGARRKLRVIDAGCGSGILAISAAKLGIGHVFAFDHDPEAVRVTRENLARNGVSGNVQAAAGELAPLLRRRRADLVLANIQADVLGDNAAALMAAVRPGGWLVLSGILASEASDVAARFRRAARAAVVEKVEMTRRRRGEWASLTLRFGAAE